MTAQQRLGAQQPPAATTEFGGARRTLRLAEV